MKKIDEYTALQNDYKSDRLTVKVNWDLQDSKYEYLKNQHGIYPQVKAIHRPGPYGNSLGGVSYDGGGHGYEPPKYDHGCMATNHRPTEATNPLKDLQIQQQLLKKRAYGMKARQTRKFLEIL